MNFLLYRTTVYSKLMQICCSQKLVIAVAFVMIWYYVIDLIDQGCHLRSCQYYFFFAFFRWIGLYYTLDDDSYSWTDHTALGYTNWADGEPTKRGGLFKVRTLL